MPNFYDKLYGNWHGSYSLWLRPDAEPEKSEITALFQPAAKGAYTLMTYDWNYSGKPQAGIFLLYGHDKTAAATWGDSFHMAPEPMLNKGTFADNGEKLILLGSYEAGDGPDWGWRTIFTVTGPDSFLMESYNITPDGQEVLAVRAELTRKTEK